MTKLVALYQNGEYLGLMPYSGDDQIDAGTAESIITELGLLGTPSSLSSILRQARSFEEAARSLYKIDSQNLTVPIIVNGAFCIELLLKSIHLKLGNNEHGHKLGQLYQTLPDDTKKSIKNNFYSSKYNSIENALSELNIAFVEWRYMHEKSKTSIISTQVIFEVIDSLIIEVK